MLLFFSGVKNFFLEKLAKAKNNTNGANDTRDSSNRLPLRERFMDVAGPLSVEGCLLNSCPTLAY